MEERSIDPSAAEPVLAGTSAGGPTDGELVARAVDGDRPAFDALEVSQDAFLKAYSSLAGLQKVEAFGGWLMRIVSNLSLNYRRSRRTRSQLPLDDLLGPSEPTAGDVGGTSDWMAQDADPVHMLESKEMGRRLQTALQELPEKQRLAIVMFTIEQMPQKQVADALACSVEAVKWHVFQGRKRLRELLKDHL